MRAENPARIGDSRMNAIKLELELLLELLLELGPTSEYIHAAVPGKRSTWSFLPVPVFPYWLFTGLNSAARRASILTLSSSLYTW